MKSKKVLEIFLFSAILFGISFLFSNKEVNSVTYITDTQKKIIRDTKRLSDITKLKDAIESYKTVNGYYPKLSSGTYIKGYVNSVWSDSWTAFCNTIGLTSNCPSDPINEISNCNCDVFGSTCSSVDLDTDKCYNSKTKQFACTKGSYIYQYQVLNNGKNYSLLMDFEYNQGYGYGNYFNTNSNEDNNIIDVDDNCVSGSNEYKIMSGAAAKCGNKVVESGEFCDGNSKVEFCTNLSGVRGRIAVPCTNSCTYQNINLNGNADCNTKGFCGDSIVQTENGEACDNSSEELCFGYGGVNPQDWQHAWYNEQIRYCKDNCQYNRDATTGINAQTCGGYCGDNIVQSQEECDYNVEYLKWNGISFKQCSSYKTEGDCGNANCLWVNSACVDKKCVNYNLQATCTADSDCQFVNDSCIPKVATIEKNHCGVRGGSPCKYQNNPAIFSSSFALETRSYLQQNNSFQYSGFIAADTNNKVDVVKNSLFFDIRMKGIKDLDGDSIRYKFDFNDSANDNIGFFENYGYGDLQDVSNRSKEITGQWVQLNQDSDGYVYARIYSTSVEPTDISKIKLIDGTYFGDYSFTVSIKDTWANGANVSGNQQGVINSKSFNFYIGSTCGDFTLQSVNDDGEHEYCEYKSSGAEYFNFSDGEPSMTVSGSDTQYCVALKTGTGWSGKWDDEYCGNTSYGICKKTYDAGCGSWSSYGSSFCYKITDTKQTWDAAKTYCQNAGGDLFIVRNITENNWINSLFTTSGNNLYGQNAVWLGYYNINKIREPFDKELNPISVGEYTVDKASMIMSVEENGNSRLNINNIYDGGANELNKYSSQYLCSKSCTDIGGYCGDGVLENGLQTVSSYFGLEYKKEPKKYYYYISNFEQCDPSTNNGKIQTGTGTSLRDEYGCVNCMYNAGYCGNTIIDYDKDTSGNDNQDLGYGDSSGIDFEHCDPTHKLLPIESGNIGGLRGVGSSGYGANYVCWENSDIPSTDTNFGAADTKSPWIPYKADGVTQVGNISYFIVNRDQAKIFKPNENGVCQKSSAGYCGDGSIQVSYNQMPVATRVLRGYINPVYNSVNVYNKAPGSSYGKNSWYFSYGYGYGEDNVFTNSMKLEECDPGYFVYPEESNSLDTGYFYTINGGFSMSFNGQSKLRYYCNSGASNKCTFNDKISIYNGESAQIAESGLSFGYCGDGIISSYGAGNSFISYGITNQNTTNREECDPKNHIVGQNGTGYGNITIPGHTDKWFGCNSPSSTGTFIYGTSCSSYITPATSSANNTYACSYGCKNVTNTTYGYCGDGVLQADFFEECEYANNAGYDTSSYGNVSLYKTFSSTNKNLNYLCGKSLTQYGGYFDSEFLYGDNNSSVSSVNGVSVFSSGIMQNNLLACKTFGGYRGDGKIQACLIGGNGYGYDNWNKCYVYSVGTNSYGLISGVTGLEFCDPEDTRAGWDATYGYGCNSTGEGCDPGYYLNKGICTKCEAGYKCIGGVKNREACPIGTYQDETGKNVCKYPSPGYATSSTDTPDNSTGNTSQDVCLATYYDQRTNYNSPNDRCLFCPGGYETNTLTSTGATSCTVCPQNTYSGNSTMECTNCDSENWSNAGETGCHPCQYGTTWSMSYNCSPSNYFTASRTIISGNDAACNQDIDVDYSPCAYCSNPGGFCTTGSYTQETTAGQSSCSDSMCNNAWPGYYLVSSTVCPGCGSESEDTYTCTCSPKCTSRNTCLFDAPLGDCIVWANANNCGFAEDLGLPGCYPGYSCVGGDTCHNTSGCGAFTCRSHRICE